jgi:hypothetical protein
MPLPTSLFSSYETVKYAHIQDARLGMTRWILLVGITLYVVVIEMLQMGGYLESDPVVGVVRFSLQQPTLNNCDPAAPNCANAFAPLTTLNYCQQSHQAYNGTMYPCEIYEAVNAQVLRETSVVVWTRATTYNQSLICDGSMDKGITCPRTYQNNQHDDGSIPSPFYIAQSEAFTILLEHAVTASKICEHNPDHYSCSAQAKDYRGRLFIATDGELCKAESFKNNSYATARSATLQSSAPCFIGANRTVKDQDFFSLDVLLQAAGVSLDDCVDNGDTCTTYRESGATLLLKVVWNDFRPYRGLVEPFYYYAPQLIGTSYKESLPFYESYRSSRVLLRAHGIKVAVLVSGNFHQFHLLSFLITLTTALGLLAVATTVVDSLMLYVLPEKERYQQVKYETVQGQQPIQLSEPASSPFLRRVFGRRLAPHPDPEAHHSDNEMLATTSYIGREETEQVRPLGGAPPLTNEDLNEPLLQREMG